MLDIQPRRFMMPVAAVVLSLCLASSVATRLSAQSSPAYVAVGDSIEFGLSDDIAADGMGYVPPFGGFLSTVLGQAVAVQNFGVPFARARDILHTQLPGALAALEGHQPAIVSWGGGGNDLGAIATGPQAAACRQSQSCLARFDALLHEVELTIDHTIGRVRDAVGPNGRILMRTQYNALQRTGCATADVVALANATLEGAPGTTLERGLNDRIHSVADKYHAKVVDLFVPFFFNADLLVSADCAHPSGVGYQAIFALSQIAFLSGP